MFTLNSALSALSMAIFRSVRDWPAS